MKPVRCLWTRCRVPAVVYLAAPLGGFGYCGPHNAERLDIMERVAKLPKVCQKCGTVHSVLVSCPEAAG